MWRPSAVAPFRRNEHAFKLCRLHDSRQPSPAWRIKLSQPDPQLTARPIVAIMSWQSWALSWHSCTICRHGTQQPAANAARHASRCLVNGLPSPPFPPTLATRTRTGRLDRFAPSDLCAGRRFA